MADALAHARLGATRKERGVSEVGGRTLQYAFRRYYGTTPTGYLRRVRLERADAELRAADTASGLTVAEVAHRWGWASASQFTAAYQQRFGVPRLPL